VQIFGDGRCFFRAIATACDKNLMTADRCQLGIVKDSRLKKLEVLTADDLRSQVVAMLECENLSDDACDLNFMLDRQIDRPYASVHQRLASMRNHTEYAGFLEVLATCYVMKRRLHIYEKRESAYKLIAKLPSHCSCFSGDVISLAHRSDELSSPGHYNVLELPTSNVVYQSQERPICHLNNNPSFRELIAAQTGGDFKLSAGSAMSEFDLIGLNTDLPTSESDALKTSKGTTDVWMVPNQPQDHVFPAKMYGKKAPKKRSMHSHYFMKWPFLHWDEQSSSVFCLPCHNVQSLGMNILSRKGEQAFVSTGFSNWKDAVNDFDRHGNSQLHSESVMKWNHHLHGQSIDTVLSSEKKKQQTENRAGLHAIVTSLKYLGRQGLSCRGHIEVEGNFMQLLQLRKTDNEELASWLSRTGRETYTSHDVQNEILQLMSHSIIRKIVNNVKQARYFAIIADESTDISGKQQLSVCLRWVDETFEMHEDFIGLYEMVGANADTITTMLLDVILRLGLPLSCLRGQGYDGASVMSGSLSGVSTQIMAKEKRAVYIHCCAHSLNLALQDATRSNTFVRDALDFVRDVVNFVKASPRRCRIFDQLKSEAEDDSNLNASNLRPLCPTRWTVRAQSICSVLDNYCTLRDTLYDISVSKTSDDSGAKAGGLATKMNTFETYFGLKIAYQVFEPSEICSKKLQSINISVSEAKNAACEVAELIEKARSDASFNIRYEQCLKTAASLDIDPPELPRPHRIPKRLLVGTDNFNFTDPKSRYRRMYFEFLDTSAATIRSRFEQPGMALCLKIENALTAALAPMSDADEDNSVDADFVLQLKEICAHFNGDVNYTRLMRQLAVLRDACGQNKIKTVRDITKYLKSSFPSLHREIFSEVSLLVRLFLVIPATSATAERSFSTMRRLKNYLRSTMTTERLNSVMIMNVHKDMLDELDDATTVDEFVACNERRNDIFGGTDGSS